MHRNVGVGSWIARQAQIAPDRVALVCGHQRRTYGQLDERITRLARALETRGVGEGDRVAFLGHNHPAALEVLFACGLLGAVAVPLHPGFDEPTLAEVLDDAAPSALVAAPELALLARRVLPGGVAFITTGVAAAGGERYEGLIAGASDEPIDRPIGLEHTCLLAFTSGTTKRSRGVMLSHGNLLFNAINTLTRLDYLRDDVILTSAPLYRMGGLGFSLTMLLKGGTCVLQEQSDAETSLRLIEQHRVTVLFEAVHTLEALQRAPRFATADLSSLRICATGGSWVPPGLCDAFARRGLCLQPGYGLTEAAPLALLLDRADVATHPGAAGRPPLFTSVRIVDAELEEVAPGRLGELLVHGPNVMQGYWRAPGATAAAVVEDGWLRTGDAASAAPDGTISVVGRVSEALTLGGERVHPAPIEEAARASGLALECAIVQPEPEAAPAVFVVAPADRPLDRDALLSLLRAELPASAPPALLVVSALPRNPNGKILRAPLVARCAPSALPRVS